jgi:hypothetical protein
MTQTAPEQEISLMGPMLLKLWLTLSGKAPPKGSRRRRPAFCRPLLEVLEDRAVPASLGYFSTSLNAVVYATAVDSAGDLYVTGSAGSGFTPTPGAFQTSGGGAFVAKLNPTGGLIYATYLGSGGEGGTGIAVDAAGDAYVLSEGGSVPTTANAIAATDPSGVADFVAELNPTGSGLNYSTYLPGTVDGLANTWSYAGAIAVDGSGNIYVAGDSGGGLPVTAGAYQTTDLGSGGGNEPFFMKIDPALSGAASVVYASYLGGSSGSDVATGIAVDAAGNAYVEGYTYSTDFPTTSGAFQTSKASSSSANAFVAKFAPALSGAASLVYSTYLGGTGGSSGYVSNHPEGIVWGETAGGIAVDSAGNAYVTSATTSTNFPTTPGAYQTTSNIQNSGSFPACDVVVTKLNATGSALVYSTYLGGGTIKGVGTNSGGASIAVDASGDAYVTGWTDSTSFPTKNPVQATNGDASGYDGYGDGMNAFVTELNPAGSGLLFSTYLGNSSNNNDYYGYGIAVDSAGNAYVGGETTPIWYERTGGFAAKINLAPSPSFSVTGFPSTTTAGVAHTFTVTALNANGTVNTGYTGTVQFSSSDPQAVLPADYTFTAADQGMHTFTVTLKTAGSQSITATDTVTGSITGSETGIQVNPAAAVRLVLSGPSTIRSGTAFSITVTAVDAYGTTATGYRGTVHSSSSDSSATLPGNYTFTAADNGVHTFSRVKLRTRGLETITAIDTLFASISGSVTIQVN